VIDILVPTTPIGSTRQYDYDNETETFNTIFKVKVTLEFYGSEAYSNTYRFVNLQNTQKARDLQKQYEITLFKDMTINNLRQTINGRYFERYELEIMIQYNESLEVDTYRIEEIPIEY